MKNVAGIILLVGDIDKSKEFYTGLGFELMNEIAGVAIKVRLGEFWIELLNKSEVVTQEYRSDVESKSFGAGAYLQIEVENASDYYVELSQNGLELQNEPQEFSWGNIEFTILDPDGYKLTFLSPVEKM